MSIRRKVAYFHDPDIGSYYYGSGHPMKPQRIRMTHSLIVSYNLYKYMEVYRPHKSDVNEMTLFHDPEYVDFLASINADNYREFTNQLKRFNVGEATDCPVFEGLFQFQQSCAGASIDGASKLNHHSADICVNWSGGLHHAKMAEASGFCYINDIVLGILELLKYYARVMYIDIDVHHGDGVEEAFYVTHRVMTVSFHKFGDFFPGTGDITDVGIRKGKYYSVNVPLNDGITDEAFVDLFKTVVGKCVECYRPGAIIIQCGADSLTGDRLGRFNLTIKGHAKCVEHVRSYNIPLLVLGGGGYTIRNVARCWTYETGVVLNKHHDMPDQIGLNDYYDYYAPDFQLHLQPSTMPNYNSAEHLNTIKTKIMENLRHIEHAPGVQFSYVPPDFFNSDSDGKYEDQDEEAAGCNGEGGRRRKGKGGGERSGYTDGKLQNSSRKRKKSRKLKLDKCISTCTTVTPHLLRRRDYECDFFDHPDRDQRLVW